MQPTNLAVCPAELLAVDANAEKLWTVFLKRIGLHFNTRGEVIENDGRRAEIVRRFGVRSLIDRLPSQKTERDRARIWWREAIACSDGESDIPDLSSGNMHVLNPFIVTPALKYFDPRAERLAAGRERLQEERQQQEAARRRGRPVKPEAEKRAATASRVRAFRANLYHTKNAIGGDSVTV
jgi:hypothetical protein